MLQVEQGSLYPAWHRLIERGWITFEDGTSENNRRAKRAFDGLDDDIRDHLERL